MLQFIAIPFAPYASFGMAVPVIKTEKEYTVTDAVKYQSVRLPYVSSPPCS